MSRHHIAPSSVLLTAAFTLVGCSTGGSGGDSVNESLGGEVTSSASPGSRAHPTPSTSAETVRLILTADAGADVEALAAALQERFGEDLEIDRVFALTGQIVVIVTVAERERLDDFPGVASVQEDRPERPTE